MSIPENHVVAEGRTLRAAIESAAAQLGVAEALVAHKIDLAHFRSAAGTGVGSDTVKILAWAKDPAAMAPALAAEDWMKGLLASQDRTGTVRADSRPDGVTVFVDVGAEGRHLVGRGGATLRAIQHLMEGALAERFPGMAFRIDVARSDDGERRDRDGDDRGERRERRDRDDRRGPGDRDDRRGPGDRDERRTRGDRGDRGDRRDRRGRGSERRSEGEEEELRRLARKIANIVLDRGQAETIRRDLNSYDRRIVHMEIQTMEGVGSRSVGEGLDRRVEIYPVDGEGMGDEPETEA